MSVKGLQDLVFLPNNHNIGEVEELEYLQERFSKICGSKV